MLIAPDQTHDAALQEKLQRILRRSVKKYTTVYSREMAKKLGKYVVRPDFSKIQVPDF